MERIFEVTGRSQQFIVNELIKSIGYFVVVYFIATVLKPGIEYLAASYLFIGFIILELFPSIILHLQYYAWNSDTIVGIENVSKRFDVYYKDEEIIFYFHQIKKITLYLDAGKYRGYRRGAASWDLYHYAVIELEDGKKIVVTCLLINDLVKFFKDLGLETEKEKIIFPLILKN